MIPFPGDFTQSRFAAGYKYDPEDSLKNLENWNDRWQEWLQSENYKAFIWYMRNIGIWEKPCDDEWINSHERGAKP